MTEPTPRQIQVLVAYIEAGGSKQAASRLGVSERYVRSVLSLLHAVYGATNTAQTFAMAVQRGDVDAQALRLFDAA